VASHTGSMNRIDTETNDVVEGPPVLSEPGVNDMAFGPDGIWAVGWEGDIGPGGTAQSDLQIVDPESMEVIEGSSFDKGDIALYSVTAGEQGTVWAVNAAGDQVFKIRPESETLKEIPTGRFLVDVVTAAGGAWVSNSKSGTITELDARAGEAVGEFPVECPGDLVVAFGSLWVTNYCEDQIRRIDLSGPRVVANIPTCKGPRALVEAGGYIWVVNTLDDSVVRVDPTTDRVIGDPLEVGDSPESIASGGGALWVVNGGAGTIRRIDYEPQPEPDFTPLPTPTPNDRQAGRAEGFAIWPETTPARAEAVCGSNAPWWRASDIEVGLRFARVELGWDPRRAASAEVLVGFGELEQVKEVTAQHARFVFDAPPTDPGYFLVLLKDDGGEVISAMGSPLPAGDFNAG
jgi:DNA-binding beta-propeller fold protein YncE